MLDCVHEQENAQIHLLFVEENGQMQIEISLLWVDEGFRRKGLGTALLKKATRLADTLGVPMGLQARGDIPQEILVAFYQKHGFVVVNDAPYLMLMRREPRPRP